MKLWGGAPLQLCSDSEGFILTLQEYSKGYRYTIIESAGLSDCTVEGSFHSRRIQQYYGYVQPKPRDYWRPANSRKLWKMLIEVILMLREMIGIYCSSYHFLMLKIIKLVQTLSKTSSAPPYIFFGARWKILLGREKQCHLIYEVDYRKVKEILDMCSLLWITCRDGQIWDWMQQQILKESLKVCRNGSRLKES